MNRCIFCLLFIVSFFLSYAFGAETVTNIDAFTYVPSPNGDYISIFYNFHRPKDIEDDIQTPTGKCMVIDFIHHKIDTIKTKSYLDYTLDKDGICWLGDSAFVFSKYLVKNGKGDMWLFAKDDPYDVRTMHVLYQTTVAPDSKRKAFWLSYGFTYSRSLIIESEGKYDTLLTLKNQEQEGNGNAIDLYKIFWVGEKSIIFGEFRKSKNILFQCNIDPKGIIVLDTMDHCYYRYFNGLVYYSKDKSIVERNLSTGATKKVINNIVCHRAFPCLLNHCRINYHTPFLLLYYTLPVLLHSWN